MDYTQTGSRIVVAVGLLTAAFGVYLVASPMLLAEEHLAPLGPAQFDRNVRDLLLFGSFQIAALSLAWGLLVAGLARPALVGGDRFALGMLWAGGVGMGVLTMARMALIADWPGVAFNAVPVVLLGAALLMPAYGRLQMRRNVPVTEPQREKEREKEAEPKPR